MLFTHNRMPVFEDKVQFVKAVDYAFYCLDLGDIFIEQFNWQPTWQHDDWSQYVGDWSGRSHALVPVLRLVDQLDNNWRECKKDPRFVEAKEFFSEIRFVEQAFGLSWMVRITHCAKEDGTYDKDILAMQHFYGKRIVRTLDLEALAEDGAQDGQI